jgi:hypothetical protein
MSQILMKVSKVKLISFYEEGLMDSAFSEVRKSESIVGKTKVGIFCN